MHRFIHISLLLGFSLLLTLSASAQLTPIRIQAEIGNSENQALVESFFAALLASDYEKAESFLAPGFIYYASGGDSLDSQGMIGMWKGYDQTSSEDAATLFTTSMNVPQGAFTGDFVLSWLDASWKDHTSGDRVSSWIHEIAQVKDGKIQLIYNYQDNLAIMMKSGFTLSPPASASAEK